MTLLLHALVLALVATSPSKADVPLPPGELRGQVMLPSGLPAPHFSVNGVKFDDPLGRFKVLTPPSGEFRVVVRADGFAPNVFHVAGASGKKLQIPEIKLGGGEHVLGEVLDAETEMPIDGAKAALADPQKLERLRFIRPERLAGTGVSGTGGWFEMRRAPRGLLILVVSHPDYLTEFVAVNTRQQLPTVLMHKGGILAGRLRDPSGGSVRGARVAAFADDGLDGAEVIADAFGRYELPRLHPGSYRIIVVTKTSGADVRAQVTDGVTTELPIELGPKPEPRPQPARVPGPIAAAR